MLFRPHSLALCWALVIPLSVPLAPKAAADQPPNVLLILADDLGADELGIYGHPTHPTPHLDKLAEAGVHFATAYATPVCHPTRFTLLTGQYPHHSGVFHFAGRAGGPPVEHRGADDVATHVTLGKVFQSAGYATALTGKWQMSGELPELIHEAGFDSYRMWAYDHNLPAGITHEGGRERTAIARTSRYWHPSIVEDGDYLPTGPDDYGPDLFTDFLIDFIRDNHRDTAGKRPFFAYYPMALTHEPYYPTPHSIKSGEDKYTHDPANWTANVAYTDHLVGRLLAILDDLKIRENTIVVFVGDNGTGLAGKGHTTEIGVRVPLIISMPGQLRRSGLDRALTDITDLFPTLLAAAGISPPPDHHLDGHSLLPYLKDEADAPRDWIYAPLGGRRTLRTERWLLENNTPWVFGQLFDCGDQRDGTGYQEVTNDASPEIAAARRELQAILATLPVPEVAADHPLLWPRDQPFHLMAGDRTILNSPAIIDLWPEGVPGQRPDPPAQQSDGERYWSIHYPSMTVFPSPDPLPGAPLILVIPGGGYKRNGWLNGGLRLSHWLNSIGITAAVLKYRLDEYDYPTQLQDAQRALRILRQRATDFGGSPANIGVIGGSAGGHLAAHLSTAWDLDTGVPADLLGHISARPDFQMLLYPVISGRDPHAHIGSRHAVIGRDPSPAQISAFSIEENVRPDTPPTFIVTTADDKVVPVENSLLLYQALQHAEVTADLHVFQSGPHGFSNRQLDLPVEQWTELATRWLQHHKFLPLP